MPNETLDAPVKGKETITVDEAEEIGEAALEAVPVEIDPDPARLIHEEFPSLSPRPDVRIGRLHHGTEPGLHSGRQEQAERQLDPEEAVKRIHAFAQSEDDLLHQQRSIDRLNAQKAQEELAWLTEQRTDMLGFSESDLEKRFKLIEDVAQLRRQVKPEDLPDHWGEALQEISPEQIGRDTALLARLFKRGLIDGSLTAYKDLQKATDQARLEATPDEDSRQKLEAAVLSEYQKQFQVKDRKRQAARQNNERAGLKYADESLDAPYLLERMAVTLTDEDLTSLLSAPEVERIKVIAELTDPYRLRLDKDAGHEAKATLQKEALQIGVLLESLPESWQRDLLAVEAWRFYMHKNVGDIEKATKVLELVSAPEIKNGMKELHKRLEGKDPEQLVKILTEHSSKKALETLTHTYGSNPEDLMREAEAKKPGMRITINIRSQSSEGRSQPGITTIEKILLDSRRVLSAHEVGRKSSMSGADARSRSIGESRAGFDPLDVITDRPVYGTLVETDEDKLLGDPDARWYGSCVIMLRPEVAARSTFSWGDSARAWSGGTLNIGAGSMAFEEAAAAKLLFDKRRPNRNGRDTEIGKEYIEAQILGGVSADDIEAISIPFEEVVAHRMSLRALATEYPSIKFRCVLRTEQAAKKAEIKEKLKEFKNVEIVAIDDEKQPDIAIAA